MMPYGAYINDAFIDFAYENDLCAYFRNKVYIESKINTDTSKCKVCLKYLSPVEPICDTHKAKLCKF